MRLRLKEPLAGIAKSRVTLAVGIMLVLGTTAQSAVLGVVDLDARENGGMIATLGGAKLRLLVAAFPDQTVQYLQSFPLCLIGAAATVAAVVPLLLVAIGAAGLAPQGRASAPEDVASRPIDDFIALWTSGCILCAASVITVSLVTFLVSRPDDGLALLTQSVALCGFSVAFVLPATGLVVALRAFVRSRWVVLFTALAFLVLTDAKGLPAGLAWLAPRTYENYSMSASWSLRFTGLLGLALWGGAGLLIASWMSRRRTCTDQSLRAAQRIETVGRTG